MDPLLADPPSHCLVLLCIVAINGIIVMGAFMLVRAGLASMTNGYVITAIATHIPVIVVLDWIWFVLYTLLLPLW